MGQRSADGGTLNARMHGEADDWCAPPKNLSGLIASQRITCKKDTSLAEYHEPIEKRSEA